MEINTEVLGLPVAGLMSTDSCEVVAEKYTELVKFAKEIGCTLHSPFMSLVIYGIAGYSAVKTQR
jgi:adenine deaminase